MPQNLIMFTVHFMTISNHCNEIIKVSVCKFCWYLTSHPQLYLPTSQIETLQTPMLFIMDFLHFLLSFTTLEVTEASMNVNNMITTVTSYK